MWPLLIIAGSMLAKHMASEQAQKRQTSMQGAMESYQRSKAQQNESAINNLVSQQTPAARSSELHNIDAARQQSMQGAVDAARTASPVTQAAGTTGGDFARASESAATRVADRTKKAIEQLGLMGAPGEQAIASGTRFGRAAGNVDANNSAIGNVGAGFMRDINLVRPNPTLNLLGDAGMAVGGAMLGGAGGAAAGGGASMVNNAQGFEDASGNLYSDATTVQDANIQRQLAMKRAMTQWGR